MTFARRKPAELPGVATLAFTVPRLPASSRSASSRFASSRFASLRWIRWPLALVVVAFAARASGRYAAGATAVPGTVRDRLHLGGVFANGKSPVFDGIGRRVHLLACEAGDARSCTNVGRIYDEGWGVARDIEMANRYYGHACRAGDGFGCFYLGVSYEVGDGLSPDPEAACALHVQACTLGEEYGCYRAGVCHDLGLGVRRDPAKAVSFYELACTGGSPSACAAMGAHTATTDRATAAAFYRRACSEGHAGACNGLRMLFAVPPPRSEEPKG